MIVYTSLMNSKAVAVMLMSQSRTYGVDRPSRDMFVNGETSRDDELPASVEGFHADLATNSVGVLCHARRGAPSEFLDLQRRVGNRATYKLIQRLLSPAPATLLHGPDSCPRQAGACHADAEDVDDFLGPQSLAGNRAVAQPLQAIETPLPGAVRGNSETQLAQLGRDASSASSASPSVSPIVGDLLRSPGQPLDAVTRAFMEPRFGHDFSRVRVHTDSLAAESARSVLARAYAVGVHVVFGAGDFAPGTQQGRELLAHELAHTVQQRGVGGAPLSLASDGVSERSAEAAGREIANGRPLSTALPVRAVGLARAPVPIDAYPPDMLAKALAEVKQRLKKESYSGRDRDVDLHMALKWEADKRARGRRGRRRGLPEEQGARGAIQPAG